MKNPVPIIVLVAFVSLSFNSVFAKETDPLLQAIQDIDLERMMADITELSSPHFEGRQAGTLGGRRSADFVATRMKQLGLRPAGNAKEGSMAASWFQQTSISVTHLPNTALLEFSYLQRTLGRTDFKLRLGQDFLPVLDSPAVNITAPLIFVGYGIDDPARGVDDYEGIDVRNRVVMFLRGKPSHYPKWVTHAEKERIAREKGAAGFITLTGPILNRYEARRGMGHAPMAMYSRDPDDRPLPGCWMSGQFGETLFESRGLSLQAIQAQLNEEPVNHSQELDILAHVQWDSTTRPGTLINVLGVIPGSDPRLGDDIVIVGAHRDHFGEQAGLLFAGADDNASGTALLLEVARLFAKAKPRPERTIMFISFSGEERGLIGSRLYVNAATYPLGKTVAMINVDHVGVGNGQLTIGMSRLPKTISQQAADLVGLRGKTNFYGLFPGGDHVPFGENNISTIAVVSSGPHTSFHQSSDSVDKIQPQILEMATQYVTALTWLLANPS